jgi:hypothetical protein
VRNEIPVNDQRIRKSNLGYLPSDGERLSGYVKRLKDIQETLRYGGDNKLHQEKFWCHINPRSSYCWVCDLLDMVDYILGLLEDMDNNSVKMVWICKRPPNTHDSMTFEFVPSPIRKKKT